MIKMNLENAQFDYEPYPVCYIPNIFDAETYRKLSDTYPDLSKFDFRPNLGNKYSLTERARDNQTFYHEFLRQQPVWGEFYNRIKSKEFVQQVIDLFRQHHVDTGIKEFKYEPGMTSKHRGLLGRILDVRTLRSRFEFSVMTAHGGNIKPHTDAAKKLITLVFSFIKPGEWNDEWGGGTDVVLPKDRSLIYNHMNKQLSFEETEHLKTYPFVPNQGLAFIKTFNSWHSVAPMTGPDSALRKTVTINIEDII